jgi:hypothetical protein
MASQGYVAKGKIASTPRAGRRLSLSEDLDGWLKAVTTNGGANV